MSPFKVLNEKIQTKYLDDLRLIRMAVISIHQNFIKPVAIATEVYRRLRHEQSGLLDEIEKDVSKADQFLDSDMLDVLDEAIKLAGGLDFSEILDTKENTREVLLAVIKMPSVLQHLNEPEFKQFRAAINKEAKRRWDAKD